MISVKGWHTGRLWSMILSASLRTVILCFSSLLPYYKNPFLDLGKNIVKWLGQCFLPELAIITRSFLLNPKYNDTVPLCLKIREAKDGNGTGDLWSTTVRNRRVFFLDEVAFSKLNLHEGFFRNYGHLGLFEAKHTCVIDGLARYSFVCFQSKRVDRCVWC